MMANLGISPVKLSFSSKLTCTGEALQFVGNQYSWMLFSKY